MRDYQAKNNEHWIPHNQYMQALYFIRSYYEKAEEYDAILAEIGSPSDMDGMPHGTSISDQVAAKASRLEPLRNDMLIIESALDVVPERYQEMVWKNVMCRDRFLDCGVSPRTLSKYKYRFIHEVATNKGIINF